MNVTDRLVDFITRCSAGPDQIRHIVQLSMLDWAAVARTGQDEPVVKIVRDMVAQEGGHGQAYAIGLSEKVPARAAALVNGTASHALDYDDTHFAYVGHPSAAVLPAVLALADKIGADMGAVQGAAQIGLETAVRVGIWLGRDHYRSGFHITSTAGTYGAVAASARLFGLTPQQTRMALGLAASRASGVKEQFGTMGKPYHAGMAASAGLEAALLAGRNFQASDDGLSGEQGFAVSHHGENNSKAFEGLGESWIFESVSHKFHACCHGTHAMLEALMEINAVQTLQPDAIDQIEVTTHPQYLHVCNIREPCTGLEAKFSYRLIAAMAVCGIDTSHPGSFTNSICVQPELVGLRDRTFVKTDASLSDSLVKVVVKQANGSKLTADYDLLSLTDSAERERRVRAKAASLLGTMPAMALWENITNISDLGNCGCVGALLLGDS